jgi:hypothetical protein
LDDPHGTHRKCLKVILEIHAEEIEKCKNDVNYQSLFPAPDKIYFYRGAWE